MSVIGVARRLQFLDRLFPVRWRLPLRYRGQFILRALEPEIALLPHLLREARGRTALDVGANVGIYTYALARAGMEVHAFEPQPACSAVIAAWASGRKDIHVHPVGVGAEAGGLVLHTPVVGRRAVTTRASFDRVGPGDLETAVRVVTLDSIDATDVGFVKIDVEGFEMPVLLGARHLLEQQTPLLLVEIDRTTHDRESFDEIITMLQGFGYRAFYCEGDRLVSAPDDPWDSPAKVYNFVFRT